MLSANTFHMLFIVAFLIGFATAAIHRGITSAKAGDISTKNQIEGEGALLFAALRITGLAMWGSAVLYSITPRLMGWASLTLPDWLRLGAAVVAIGILPPITISAARAIGKNVTRSVAIRDEHQLVTSGPYRYIRHPLYTVGILFFGSLSLIAANWFMILSAGLVFILVTLRLRKEEAELIDYFGDAYRHYIKRTRRFLPRFTRQ